jgi:hypothetical protein
MRVLRYLMASATAGMLLWGCGGNDKGPAGPGDGTYDGTLNATIRGDLNLDFRCSTAYGIKGTGDSGQGTTGSMHVQGVVTQGADEYMIDIQVYRDPATGTYQLTFPAVAGVATVIKNNVGNLSESGSVTFSQVSSTRLAGTFSFQAFRMASIGEKVTVTVTSGTFDVPVILSN